ncbi:hypothetical protein CRG98_025174 [Punica granatum]|uniref:DUF4283 domain-containing protein n=1 Tax=Punica granatum TaxID=22663 RepID=A0A2I0JDU1_PUNGR|nr:hypothetical protein CRG98_025174 [Punica granatum]
MSESDTGESLEAKGGKSKEEKDQLCRSVMRVRTVEYRRSRGTDGEEEMVMKGRGKGKMGGRLSRCLAEEGTYYSNKLCPKILVTQVELEQFRAQWGGSLIVKVLGRRESYGVLENRLQKLWNPKGDLSLTDLPNDFFIVKFTNDEDRDFTLHGGPWLVLGHYLTIREWVLDFLPNKAKIDRVAVWVRIPNLPMEYRNEVLLRQMGYAFVDRSGLIGTRWIRIEGILQGYGVEVKLEEPFTPFSGVIGFQGIMGAGKDKEMAGPPVSEQKGGSSEFGPWMIVQVRTSKSRNYQKFKGYSDGKEASNQELHA